MWDNKLRNPRIDGVIADGWAREPILADDHACPMRGGCEERGAIEAELRPDISGRDVNTVCPAWRVYARSHLHCRDSGRGDGAVAA